VKPSLLSAALVIVMLGFAIFSFPAIIGTSAHIDVLSVQIVNLVLEYPSRQEQALVLSVFMVCAVGAAWWAQGYVVRRGLFAKIEGKGLHRNHSNMGLWRTPVRVAMLLYVFASTVVPLGALVLVSLQTFWRPEVKWNQLGLWNYAEILQRAETRAALQDSIFLGATGATIGVVAAAMIVQQLQRGGWLGTVIDGVIKIPTVVPRIVIGVAFVVALAGPPLYWGGTLVLLLAGYVVVNMPQASVVAGGALSQVGRELREASAAAGAGQTRTFFEVVFPLALPGLLAAWALLFVVMAGDLELSVMLASAQTPVVGFDLLNLWNHGSYPNVAALGSLIALSSTAIVGSIVLFSRWRSLAWM
jgi:iron(III) transport system permease protein